MQAFQNARRMLTALIRTLDIRAPLQINGRIVQNTVLGGDRLMRLSLCEKKDRLSPPSITLGHSHSMGYNAIDPQRSI